MDIVVEKAKLDHKRSRAGVNTKVGKRPVVSNLSYQASYTEANFTATADLNVIARSSQPLDPGY